MKLDVPRPEDFSGEADDVQPFVRRVKSYFIALGNEQASEQRKIAFAIQLMNKGAGKIWRDSYYENNEGNLPVYATFADFVKELEDSFRVFDAVGKSIKILLGFQQKNQSTSTYVSKFKSLAMKAGQKDAEVVAGVRHENNFPLLQQVFKEGLRKSLLCLCLGQATLPRTMKEWYDLALRLDSQTDGDRGNHNRDPNAMDIDAVQTTDKKTRWAVGCCLSDAEKKEHWDANLCFYCHKPNHSARDCRTKQRDI